MNEQAALSVAQGLGELACLCVCFFISECCIKGQLGSVKARLLAAWVGAARTQWKGVERGFTLEVSGGCKT